VGSILSNIDHVVNRHGWEVIFETSVKFRSTGGKLGIFTYGPYRKRGRISDRGDGFKGLFFRARTLIFCVGSDQWHVGDVLKVFKV